MFLLVRTIFTIDHNLKEFHHKYYIKSDSGIITTANSIVLLKLMTKNPELTSIDEQYEANVSLIYDYVEKSIKEIQDISDNTNTKLGLLIGFNLTFIRFFLSELPDNICDLDLLPCNSCWLLKIKDAIEQTISIP